MSNRLEQTCSLLWTLINVFFFLMFISYHYADFKLYNNYAILSEISRPNLPFPTRSIYNPNANFEKASNSIVEFFPVTISLKILACDRPKSLERLIASIDAAEYPKAAIIDVDIFIDYPSANSGVFRVDRHKLVINIAHAWQWQRGQKHIHVRKNNVGLLRQWLEAWEPRIDLVRSTNDDMSFSSSKGYKNYTTALILEDDLELSPVYYVRLHH